MTSTNSKEVDVSAEPLTFDDELPRRQWTPDKHGVLRMAPPRQRALQAELCEALAAVKAGEPLKVRREAPEPRTGALQEVQYTEEEMAAAAAAYAAVRAGRLEALTERQKGALRAHWMVKARARKGRPPKATVDVTGTATAVEQIIGMVDEGMSLADIAKRRGCQERAVLKRLQEAGLRNVADELRGPVARGPAHRPAVDEILRMVAEGLNLVGIAEARGCSRKAVIHRLREAGHLDVIERLRRPSGVGSPVRVNEGDGAPMCEADC